LSGAYVADFLSATADVVDAVIDRIEYRETPCRGAPRESGQARG
jgi:hypothetical protein